MEEDDGDERGHDEGAEGKVAHLGVLLPRAGDPLSSVGRQVTPRHPWDDCDEEHEARREERAAPPERRPRETREVVASQPQQPKPHGTLERPSRVCLPPACASHSKATDRCLKVLDRAARVAAEVAREQPARRRLETVGGCAHGMAPLSGKTPASTRLKDANRPQAR